jgi:hypothetical protein
LLEFSVIFLDPKPARKRGRSNVKLGHLETPESPEMKDESVGHILPVVRLEEEEVTVTTGLDRLYAVREWAEHLTDEIYNFFLK